MGHTEIVKLLLGKGADENAQKALDGLIAACEKGHTEIVKHLFVIPTKNPNPPSGYCGYHGYSTHKISPMGTLTIIKSYF